MLRWAWSKSVSVSTSHCSGSRHALVAKWLQDATARRREWWQLAGRFVLQTYYFRSARGKRHGWTAPNGARVERTANTHRRRGGPLVLSRANWRPVTIAYRYVIGARSFRCLLCALEAARRGMQAAVAHTRTLDGDASRRLESGPSQITICLLHLLRRARRVYLLSLLDSGRLASPLNRRR